jgi:sterol 3beta-glucosyltransferase
MVNGSRGDIQPYVALGMGLKSKGYSVGMLLPENLKAFAEDAGLQSFGALPDVEEIIKTNRSINEAMNKGDTMRYLKGLAENAAEFKEHLVRNCVATFEEFKPDLVVMGTLMFYWRLLSTYKWKIPTMSVLLQGVIYDPKRMCLGLPTLPFGLHRYLLWNVIIGGVHDGFKVLDDEAKKQWGYGVCDTITRNVFLENYKNPPLPIYITQSPLFTEILCPCAHANYEFSGSCIIPSETQQRSPSNFGTTKQLEKFIAAGKKPVYCGWGSMTCQSPEYMVELVVRALAHCKQRAIVLGGWANLSTECLKRATQDDLLLKYAEENILFVEKAPHEWLFPQVACTVHHGGVGTMTAAMRAGIPTIITPVWLDQYDHAYLVNELGVGIGFNKQFQKTTATELGDAIASVIESPSIVAKAKDVGAKLCAENGVQAAVQGLEKYWADIVLSGKFRSHVEETIQTKPAGLTWCSCFEGTRQKSSGGKSVDDELSVYVAV